MNRIRVGHAVNPRFPAFDDTRLSRLLATAASTAEAHFGVRVDFGTPGRVPIDALFATVPGAVRRLALRDAFDFKGGQGDRTRLVAAMAAGIEHSLRINGTTLETERAFAAPYLLAPPAEPLSVHGLALTLVETMLERLSGWRALRAADGDRVIDASPWNEWALWNVLGYGRLPFDLVVTNQLVASAEYTGLAVHSAIRGGITTGSTSFSEHGRYGTCAFLSTFVFDDPYRALAALRDGERYPPGEAASLAGAYAAHELGHLLLHLGHPFGNPACVMRPAVGLDFRGWAAGLDPRQCALESSDAMRVGPARIFRDASLDGNNEQ